VRLLLDTDALLWLLDGDQRLGVSARQDVERADILAVSVASLWEIAIKVSLAKLAPIPGLHRIIAELGFERLAISDAHLLAVESLPYHHRDPFDRLLISQAKVEAMTVLTSDPAFADYGIEVSDARA
jgi:PIN domain nuclease of toxin-antitoxin system